VLILAALISRYFCYFFAPLLFRRLFMKLGKAIFFSVFLLISSQAFGVTQTINFSGTSFSPNTLSVTVGDVINFVGSFAFHIIQSTGVPAGAAAFGPTNAGTVTFSYTVTVAGTYNYQCNIHAAMGMTGTFTATAATGPNVKGITVSTTSLDFGSKRVTTTNTLTAQVNSVGPDASLTISSSPLSTGTVYSTSPNTANRVIAVGSSETETVTFKPTSRGTFTDVLTINSDATTAADQAKTISITGKGINGEFTGAATLDFGNLRVNANKQLTYTFTNTGDDDLFITSATPTGVFTVVTQPASDIVAGGGGTVVIKFSPTAKQAYSGTLTMSAQNNVSIPSITLTGSGTAPVLSVQNTLNLGLTVVGQQLQGQITITNNGNDTLHVTSVSLTQTGTKFSIGSTNGFNILPSANNIIIVSYTSSSEGNDNATFVINSDDLASPTAQVAITAQSGLPKMSLDTKDTIDFGNVNIGGTGTANLNIADPGSFDLQAQITGFAPSQFSLLYLAPNIPAQNNTNAVLQFQPTAEGLVRGSAVVTSNDTHNSKDTIYMKGVGVHSALVFPSSIDFQNVILNTTKDSVLTFTNLGTGNATIFSYKLADTSHEFILLDTVAHSIKASDSVKIKVRFAPTVAGAYSAVLSVITDDAAPVRKITLAGNGIDTSTTTGGGKPKLSTDVSSIDFGTIDSGATQTKKFTLVNKGNARANINGIIINGSPYFSKGTLITPFSLDSGFTKDISITFAPLAAGNFTGSVAINSVESAPLSVNLQGVGKVTVVVGLVKDVAKEYGLQILFSPNPASGMAALKVTLGKSSDMQFDLFDATGRLIRNLAHARYDEGEFSLPVGVQTLPSGEYHLRIMLNGQSGAEAKIVVVH